tara:strand:+ start:2870 stop:3163 length:294 start_codon:yes stop_codon:yes gene_type:complete
MTTKDEAMKGNIDMEAKYDIDEENDYVIVLKPKGVNEFYLPKQVLIEDDEGNAAIDTENVDIRFVSTSFSLKDKATFEQIIERFNEYAASQAEEEEV